MYAEPLTRQLKAVNKGVPRSLSCWTNAWPKYLDFP